MKFKIGQEVYVEELKAYGTVYATNATGSAATSVRVKLPSGTKIIDTINMTITIVSLLGKLWRTIKEIWQKRD